MDWVSYLIGVATPIVVVFVVVVVRSVRRAYRLRKELKDLWGRG